MKKTFYIIIFLTLHILTHGQTKLMGTYQEISEIGRTTIKFLENDRFEYDVSTCIKTWTGSGTYKITGSRLKLFFSKADSTKNTHFSIKQGVCKDTNFIVVNVTDLENEPLPFTNVIVLDKTKKQTNFVTNTQGKIKFDSKRLTFPIQIKVYYSGTTNLTINVKDKNCLQVDTYINIYGPEIISETIENWKILKIDSTQLILKPGDTWHLKKIN